MAQVVDNEEVAEAIIRKLQEGVRRRDLVSIYNGLAEGTVLEIDDDGNIVWVDEDWWDLNERLE
jgi:hypothetical protein